jgi:hypothetical protein
LVCANVGLNNVLLIATDTSGNQSFKPATITLVDNLAPVIVAPVSVLANANASCSAPGINLGTPVTIDNCTVDTVTNNAPATFPMGVTTVTWTVTDRGGNSATATQTVTVTESVLPTIIAPAAVFANTNTGCSAIGVTLGTPVTADNCTVASVTNDAPSAFPIGNTTVTWTAKDSSNNIATATQIVTVVDATAPTVITKDITIQLDASGNATLTAAEINNGSSDNCGISTMTVSQDTFTISDIGIKTITLTVTDNSGNTSSATAQVTVDGTLGTINLKNNVFVIYPIPFDSYINITLPDSYTDDVIYIQVYDLTGRAVYNQKHVVDNHNVTISDMNQYSDGSYYINLLDANQTVIQSKHILKKAKQ